MKRISNPTENDVSIVIDGIDYTVEANDSIDIQKDDHAKRWHSIHTFLTINDIENMDTEIKTEEEVVEVEEEATEEEVVDEAEEETEEETEEEVEEEVEEEAEEVEEDDK